MELSLIIPHIEALIFASDKPLPNVEIVEHINNALGFIEDRASIEQIDAAIEGIQEKYSSEFYAFELKAIGGGWQFLTKKDYHKTVAQLNGDKFMKRLSTAALETLSIIAYKQPITKSEVEAIRGVNCDYAVQKLLEKDLVIIAGRKEEAVGQPLIYATSKSFMDYFGINSAADLPQISEVLMEELVQATNVQDAQEEMRLENEAQGQNNELDFEATEENELEEVLEVENSVVVDDVNEQDEKITEEKLEDLAEVDGEGEEDENIEDEKANEEESDEEEKQA